MDKRLPILVLTGCLGSGKTTFLNRILSDPAYQNAAVIINEVGEIGLDHHLVQQRAGETALLLAAGCVCCTLRGDLADGLRDLFQGRVTGRYPAFDRVILETTGIADPGPILQTLLSDPLTAARYRVEGVITLIDALNGDWQLDCDPVAVRQVALADQILLTKADLVADRAALSRLSARLASLTATPPILLSPDAATLPDFSAALGAKCGTKSGNDDPTPPHDPTGCAAHCPHPNHHHTGPLPTGSPLAGPHDHDILTMSFSAETDLDAARVLAGLRDLVARIGHRLLRLKAILSLDDRATPLALHAIRHTLYPPERLAGQKGQSGLVIILDRKDGPDAVTLSLIAEAIGALGFHGR